MLTTRRLLAACLSLVILTAGVLLTFWYFVLPARATLPNVLWTLQLSDSASIAHPTQQYILASEKNVLHAIEPQSGTFVWSSAALDGRYVSDLLTIDDSVVAVMSQDTTSVSLHALSTTNGSQLWGRGPFVDKIDAGILPFASTRHIYVGNEHNVLWVLDAETGRVVREIALGRSVLTQPLVSDGRLFYMLDEGLLVARKESTGKKLWETYIEGTSLTRLDPAGRHIYDTYVADSVLVIWDNLDLRAFDVRTGEKLWFASFLPDFLYHHNQNLYVTQRMHAQDPLLGTKWQFVLQSINLRTGAVQFQRTYDGVEGNPFVARNDILVVAGPDYVYGLDPKQGSIRWHIQDGTSYEREAVFHSNEAYFASAEATGFGNVWLNTIQAVDVQTGQQLWHRSSYYAGRPYDNLYATKEVVIVQGDDGTLTGLPLETP